MKTAINKMWKSRGRINKSFTGVTSTLELKLEDRVGFHHSKKGKDVPFYKRGLQGGRQAGMEVFIPVFEMRSRP